MCAPSSTTPSTTFHSVPLHCNKLALRVLSATSCSCCSAGSVSVGEAASTEMEGGRGISLLLFASSVVWWCVRLRDEKAFDTATSLKWTIYISHFSQYLGFLGPHHTVLLLQKVCQTSALQAFFPAPYLRCTIHDPQLTTASSSWLTEEHTIEILCVIYFNLCIYVLLHGNWNCLVRLKAQWMLCQYNGCVMKGKTTC